MTATDLDLPPTEPASSPPSPSTPGRSATARLGSWPVWCFSAVAFALFAAVFFTSSASFSIPTVEAACGQAPPDVRFHSTAAEVDDFLTACGVDGRAAYRHMQVADLFYPLVFGVFMASSLALALGRLFPHRPRLAALAWLALLGSGFDYLENALAWRALATFPERAATSSLLGVATAAKTTTFWIAGVALVVTLAALFVGAVRRRFPQSTLDPIAH